MIKSLANAALNLVGGSWIKMAIFGLGALFVSGIVAGGYTYVTNMQDKLIEYKEEAATQTILRFEAEDARDKLQADIEDQVARYNQLQIEFMNSHEAWDSIEAMLEKDEPVQPKPESTGNETALYADYLTRLSRDTNRMLEDATSGKRAVKPASPVAN